MNSHWMTSGTSNRGFNWLGGETVSSDTGLSLEAVLGDPNFKHIWWLEEALKAARKIARIKMPNGSATGFMISDDILMTNNHVFENADQAAGAKIQFNYRMQADDTVAVVDNWDCDPDDLFLTNANLDYSIVRIKDKDNKKAGQTYGFFDLRHGVTPMVNQRANIIQHPQGRFKEIAFRDNQVKFVNDDVVQYLTDTDYGTSGSPVLDDWFRCVALHNQRVRDPAQPHRWYRNQGYRVDRILADTGNSIP